MEILWSPIVFSCDATFSCVSSPVQRKMARLLKYLQFRDYKSKLLKTVEEEEQQQDTGTHVTPQFSCRLNCYLKSWFWSRWSPAAAATRPGFSPVDGSDWRTPDVSRATGGPRQTGEDGGQRSRGVETVRAGSFC